MEKDYMEMLAKAMKEKEAYRIVEITDPVLIEMMEAEKKYSETFKISPFLVDVE